jgi:hypothetical protein
MRRIFFDSARALRRCLPVIFVLVLGFSLAPACQSKVQNVSIDIGGGKRKGSPPMCFQYKSEVRATASAYDIFLHLNNTCSYTVDCVFYDDVTEQQHPISEPPYTANSVILASNVPAKRVDIDVECTWKP